MLSEIGNEDNARGFINDITNVDNFSLISHIDLDCLACAKIIDLLVDPDIILFLDYENFKDEYFLQLKDKNINKIIFTDLNFKDSDLIKKLESFAQILIIDHHVFDEDLNSKKTVFINKQDYCAAFICYDLFKDYSTVKKV